MIRKIISVLWPILLVIGTLVLFDLFSSARCENSVFDSLAGCQMLFKELWIFWLVTYLLIAFWRWTATRDSGIKMISLVRLFSWGKNFLIIFWILFIIDFLSPTSFQDLIIFIIKKVQQLFVPLCAIYFVAYGFYCMIAHPFLNKKKKEKKEH